ncbi:MAG: hypothetical protein EON60_01965 [Alphaproteobacteria bacterium]|nr:MAG: hypothetical protein EON60_01965 [Alphaproteobacteria bacterium]
MNIVLKCVAALGLLTLTCGNALAMAEYGLNEVALDERGCWSGDDPNYGATGSVKGKRYLGVRMLPVREVAAVGPMNDAGYLNVTPKVFDAKTGKDVGKFIGMSTTGYAIFWMEKPADYTVIYYSDFKTRETYDGWLGVCVQKNMK